MLNPDALPDSPYALELRRATPHLRFQEPVEAEYLSACLSESQLLIRVACVLCALLALVRGVELLYAREWKLISLIDVALVIVISLALAAIAWSAQYQRLYTAWARILVPVRNVIVAAQVAAVASHGDLVMLMVLPVMLFGPLFFLGLRYRPALLCSTLTVIAYTTSAALSNMPLPVAIRSCGFLLAGLIAYFFAARHIETTSRLAFLKGRLITELAQHDSLTRTKNRRVFDEHFSELWHRAIDERRGLAVLLIDVDCFKAYNDRYGHQAGDRALCCVAEVLRKFVWEPAYVLARYGGEEFAMVLYDSDITKARELAERMRRAVAELDIEHEGSTAGGRVTISVGVTAVVPSVTRSPRGALQLADEALYEAKVRGRNRVAIRNTEHHDALVTGVFTAGTAGFPTPQHRNARSSNRQRGRSLHRRPLHPC